MFLIDLSQSRFCQWVDRFEHQTFPKYTTFYKKKTEEDLCR